LEFDGDRLESVRQFNASSQRSKEAQEDLLILPMKEFSLKRGGMDEILRALDQRAGELEMDRREKRHLMDTLREGIPFPGVEYLAPYFYPKMAPIISYLPQESLIWLDGADRVEAEAERFGRLVWQRCASAKEERRLVPEAQSLFLNEHEWRAALEPFSRVHGESLMVMAASEGTRASTLTVESFLTGDVRQETAARGGDPSLLPLVERIKSWQTEKLIFVAPTKADAARLHELLASYDLPIPLADEAIPAFLARPEAARAVVIGQLHQGFRIPEARLVLVTFDEIFGTRKRQPATAKSYPSHYLTSLSELKQND
jgi:transcription-repair coupling factor (superfamily II helicase)